jgi:hypothetical protein
LCNKIKTFLEKRAEILLGDMKGQWDEHGGRILLGENTGGGAVMREGRSGSSVLQSGI